jgi:hypothetical protein
MEIYYFGLEQVVIAREALSPTAVGEWTHALLKYAWTFWKSSFAFHDQPDCNDLIIG